MLENTKITNAYGAIDCLARIESNARKTGCKILRSDVEDDGTLTIKYVNRLGRTVTTKIPPQNANKRQWNRKHFGELRGNGIVPNIIDKSYSVSSPIGTSDTEMPDYLVHESDVHTEINADDFDKIRHDNTIDGLIKDFGYSLILLGIYQGGYPTTSISDDEYIAAKAFSAILPHLTKEDIAAIRKRCEEYLAS